MHLHRMTVDAVKRRLCSMYSYFAMVLERSDLLSVHVDLAIFILHISWQRKCNKHRCGPGQLVRIAWFLFRKNSAYSSRDSDFLYKVLGILSIPLTTVHSTTWPYFRWVARARRSIDRRFGTAGARLLCSTLKQSDKRVWCWGAPCSRYVIFTAHIQTLFYGVHMHTSNSVLIQYVDKHFKNILV